MCLFQRMLLMKKALALGERTVRLMRAEVEKPTSGAVEWCEMSSDVSIDQVIALLLCSHP